MRYLNLVIIAILLAGCGTISSIRSETRLPESTSFAFKDDRPTEQKNSRTDKSRYGRVNYFGDDRVTPTGPELLKASLESRLHTMLAGKTVSLSEFSVYVHGGGAALKLDRLDAYAATTPGGYAGAPFAGLLLRGVEKVRNDKTVRIQIRGKVGVAEFSSDTADTYRGGLTEEDMQATLSKALDEATLQVQRAVQGKEYRACVNPPACSLPPLSGG
jgi:hypothetical protein